MLKYAKIINDEKMCDIALGTDIEYFKSLGFSEMEVEQNTDGCWYVSGHLPQKQESNYIEKRLTEYPSIGDQLDMIYWDKINNTQKWQETIMEIKNKYPKK